MLTTSFFSRAAAFSQKLMRSALVKRVPCTILFATETGKSQTFAKKLKSVLSCAFNPRVKDCRLLRISKTEVICRHTVVWSEWTFLYCLFDTATMHGGLQFPGAWKRVPPSTGDQHIRQWRCSRKWTGMGLFVHKNAWYIWNCNFRNPFGDKWWCESRSKAFQ